MGKCRWPKVCLFTIERREEKRNQERRGGRSEQWAA